MLENRVNYLDGKNWLKNAINFWTFESYDLNKIQDRFIDFCYKKRTTGLIKNYNDNDFKNKDFDFTCYLIHKIDELEQALSVIVKSSYNSYHVIMVENEVSNDGILLSKTITKYVEEVGLEYRGKIVVYCSNEDKYLKAFLILNRIENNKKDIVLEFPKISYNPKKEWVIRSHSKMDKIGLKHPAPFSYLDIEKLVDNEQISNKIILDPFLGVGSTIIGCCGKNNYCIGIELNKEFIDLTEERLVFLGLNDSLNGKYRIINGDSSKVIKKLEDRIDVVITSPPYFNILKNKNKGVRHDESQTRQGVQYYSELENDIGNLNDYEMYLNTMQKIFQDIYEKLDIEGKFYLVISDFTIGRKEKDIHSDMILQMSKAGFVYNGTSYFLQNQKAIYPFGYPYKIVLNHIFQYVIMFERGK